MRLPLAAITLTLASHAMACESASLKVAFDPRQPGLSFLSVDSLKHGDFRPSPVEEAPVGRDTYVVTQLDGWTRYANAANPRQWIWEMRCDGDRLVLRSAFRPATQMRDMTWTFNPDVSHATLLGRLAAKRDIGLPAVLHLPGMGSLRISAIAPRRALNYDAHRRPKLFVSLGFPCADEDQPEIEYTLETAAIFPSVPGIAADDHRYDGFRRDWLNALQMQAELHVLANNAASDPCAFVLYMYSDIARYTSELGPGLRALDLVRESLDRYLGGYRSYGMPGFHEFDGNSGWVDTRVPYVFLDVYPSLLISAYDYAIGGHDGGWLRVNYPGLRAWAEAMIAPNADGSPLLEYPASGNSGSWGNPFKVRPANWWDTVGFGHQDAYSNALGYRALLSMAAMAGRIGRRDDSVRYRARAAQIRDAYAAAFLDPAAGVVGGWRSGDGQLHNYFFPFVSGIAARYGLLTTEQAHRAMQGILAKMTSVGYSDFSLGLPGNLIPIRRADYVDLDLRYGGSQREDGSDGFQIYENGGTTASFAYFTMAALYKLGEGEQGDRILLPMLQAFAGQGFSGRAANGMTYDWKDWHGGAHGYEGFLVDNYYALLAVLDRAHMVDPLPPQ